MTNIKACNAYNDFVYYLKSHFIKYCEDTFENTKRITMLIADMKTALVVW